jgi:hypothetical protein
MSTDRARTIIKEIAGADESADIPVGLYGDVTAAIKKADV